MGLKGSKKGKRVERNTCPEKHPPRTLVRRCIIRLSGPPAFSSCQIAQVLGRRGRETERKRKAVLCSPLLRDWALLPWICRNGDNFAEIPRTRPNPPNRNQSEEGVRVPSPPPSPPFPPHLPPFEFRPNNFRACGSPEDRQRLPIRGRTKGR